MGAQGVIDPSEYTLTRQALGLDITLLLCYPVLLIAVPYLIGAELYTDLIYWARDPTIFAVFGHSLIHLSDSHLWTNLSAYTVLAGSAYGLALWSIEIEWFRKAFLLNLLLTPLVYTLGVSVFLEGFLGIDAVPTAGASGVISGIVGITLILFLGLTRKTTDLRFTLMTAFSFLIIFAGEMFILFRDGVIVGGIMICIGIGGTVSEILSRYRKGEPIIQTGAITQLQFAGHFLFVTVLLTIMFWSMFHPRPPAREVNMMGHAAGLLSGIVIALISHRALSGKWLSRYIG